MKTKIFSFVSIVVLVIIDQISKMVVKSMEDDLTAKAFSFIKVNGRKILDITYCENTGAAFSILSGKKLFLVGLTGLLMVLCFVYWFICRDKKQIFCLTLIIAGGIGNLIDRIFRGYVIDFFEIKLFEFGIFNVADCFVVVGVILFVIFTIIAEFSGDSEGEGMGNGWGTNYSPPMVTKPNVPQIPKINTTEVPRLDTVKVPKLNSPEATNLNISENAKAPTPQNSNLNLPDNFSGNSGEKQ